MKLELLGRINGAHDTAISCSKYSPNGSYIASACMIAPTLLFSTSNPYPFVAGGKELKIWEVRETNKSGCIGAEMEEGNAELVCILEGHQRGVNDLAWSPDGLYLVSGGDDGIAFLWSPFSDSPSGIAHVRLPKILSFSP